MRNEAVDPPWLDAALHAQRSPAIDDDGFSAGVLRRIAAPSPTLLPQAALAALGQAERAERRRVRWTIGGVVLGAVVAAAVAWLTGAPEAVAAPKIGADLAGLLVVSCSVAWLAISRGRDDTAW
jgi:hypothetical protein